MFLRENKTERREKYLKCGSDKHACRNKNKIYFNVCAVMQKENLRRRTKSPEDT